MEVHARELGTETLEVLEFADLWEHGVLPVAGGVLDQTDQAVAAVRFVRVERAKAMAALRAEK